MSALQLLGLALGLAGMGWWMRDRGDAAEGTAQALAGSVAELLQTAAVAAVLAAGVLWLWPMWTSEPLDALSLAQLNRVQAQALDWLQRAWLVPMAVACGLLALALAGGLAVARVTARGVGGAMQWALKLKAVAGLLAATSLAVSGWQAQAQGVAAQSRQMKAEWAQLRLSLAMQSKDAALAAMAEALADAMPPRAQWPALASAHSRVATYLPQRAPDGMPRRAGRAAPQPASALETQIERALPDLPYRQLAPHGQVAAPVTQRDDPLMKQVLDAAFDQSVGGPAREALLSLGHPLLDEVIAALVDPVVARPLRGWLVDLAMRHAAGQGPDALRQRARALWSGASAAVRDRLARAVSRARRATDSLPTPMPPRDSPTLRAELSRRGVPASEMDRAVESLLEHWQAMATVAPAPEYRQALMAGAGTAVAAKVVQDAQRRHQQATRPAPPRPEPYRSPPRPRFRGR